jgi:ABC-type multidrug transport system ATPase subunit
MNPKKPRKGVILLERVTKSFGKVLAVDDVSVSFSKGLTIVLGPNGAGKSTMLRCIAGLYKPDFGSIRVFGKDPYVSSELKYGMSLLSDNYALYDHLTVRSNLKFFGRLNGLKDSDAIETASSFLDEIGALQYIDSKVYQLSRGTKQKISFCRALLNDPKILLLDEPTAFLDAHSSEFVRNLILRYEDEGRSVILVTQKLDEVTRFNGRIIVMRQGTLVEDTRIEELYKSVLSGATVSIRLARPISLAVARGVPGFEWANSAVPTVLKVKIRDYKGISAAASYLIGKGAYITGIDYIEPILSNLSIGGTK